MTAPIKTAPKPIEWFLRWRGFRGITLPPLGVFVIAGNESDARLIRHESVHWAQAERMGVLKFYVVYLWLLMRHGYQDHPMEIEARKAE